MPGMEEFNNVKAALIDIKMDIPFLKIRSNRLPYDDIRIGSFDSLPGSQPQTAVMIPHRHKKQFQTASSRLFVDTEHRAADTAAFTAQMVRSGASLIK